MQFISLLRSTFNAFADLTCFKPVFSNTASPHRVIGAVAIPLTYTVKFETWLPDIRYGRALAGGNGGNGGPIGCKHSSFIFRPPTWSSFN